MWTCATECIYLIFQGTTLVITCLVAITLAKIAKAASVGFKPSPSITHVLLAHRLAKVSYIQLYETFESLFLTNFFYVYLKESLHKLNIIF